MDFMEFLLIAIVAGVIGTIAMDLLNSSAARTGMFFKYDNILK